MNIIKRNIPNGVTCLNLLSGVMSIICSFHGPAPMWGLTGLEWAWIFIGIGALADYFDGFAARLLHAYSNLGKELDSLCDLVTFGVAPALMMWNVIDWMPVGEWVKWLVLAIPACGALRLARFNVDDRQTTTFIGIPIPANAIFWIGFGASCMDNPGFVGTGWLAAFILVESWLMISPWKFMSLKMSNYGWKGNEFRWLLAVVTPVLLFTLGVQGLMWIIVFYIFISPVALRKK